MNLYKNLISSEIIIYPNYILLASYYYVFPQKLQINDNNMDSWLKNINPTQKIKYKIIGLVKLVNGNFDTDMYIFLTDLL